MSKEEVKSEVYLFVNEACEKLDYWITGMYEVNHFTLMDAETETPDFWDLEMLEKELIKEGFDFKLDDKIKKDAIENSYKYEDKDLSY